MIEDFYSNTKSLKSKKKKTIQQSISKFKQIVNYTYLMVKTHSDEYPFHQ